MCECILIMKGYKELNWKTAKGMMSDPNFLRSLMEIDFDSITQSQVKNIRSECSEVWEGAGLFFPGRVSLRGRGGWDVGPQRKVGAVSRDTGGGPWLARVFNSTVALVLLGRRPYRPVEPEPAPSSARLVWQAPELL